MRKSSLRANLERYSAPDMPYTQPPTAATGEASAILPSEAEAERRQQQSMLLAILSGLDPSGMDQPSQQGM